jgi:hypothetical protein
MREETSSARPTLVSCPECGQIAAVEWRRRLAGTSGRFDHVKLSCVARHWFLMPAESLRAA